MLLAGWPAVVDDLGDRISGTVWTNAFNAAQKAAIEALIHSAGNPLISPAALIDELVTARGTLATLDGRLDVSLNDDGTLKTQASLAALADVQAMVGHGNWSYNDDFLIWPAGDAAAPAGFALAGAGAAVARTGSGLADTTTKCGPFSAKVTRAAADTTLSHNLMNATSFAAAGDYWKSRKFGFGCWVYCGIGSIARLSFYDGTTTTNATNSSALTYHSGTGVWEWLSGVHTVSGAATQLTLQLQVLNSAGDAYFSGLTAMPGTQAPAAWIPCHKVIGALVWKSAGTLVIGTEKDKFLPARPLLIRRVQLLAGTAPAGANIIADLNVWDGAAYQSMFATKPQIADGAKGGSQVPDGTYRYRCINAATGVTYTNALLCWDLDQVGSGTTGADLIVSAQAMQYTRPQESMLDIADF